MQDSVHPRDLWTIQKWTQRPATSGLNLLIENRACVVLDCESAEKGGVDGIEELARICDELGVDLPDCPITRSANNGLHYLMTWPAHLIPSGFYCSGKLPGIDVLSLGSKVILPGSQALREDGA